jgi:two-component system chemotaxis sensor kinase CheA
MLVFRAGTGTLQALPLSLVTRLEEIEAGEFQRSGSRTLLHYRGRLVPVTPVAETQLRSQGIQPLVIVSNGDLTVALAVEAIVDIVEDTFEVEMAAEERGIIGSAMIRGRATDVLDLSHYLPLSEPGWFAAGRNAELPGRILLVEPSDFLRDMLGPVLKASGRAIAMLSDFSEAGLAGGEPIMTAMLDLDRDSDAAFAFAALLRERTEGERPRILGLTTCATPDLHMRAVQAGLDDVVAKFDRRALLSELSAAGAALRHAA